MSKKFWKISIYSMDREYGGCEEGGWWYDCGDKVGLLEANIAYGLSREELRNDVAAVVLRAADALKSD